MVVDTIETNWLNHRRHRRNKYVDRSKSPRYDPLARKTVSFDKDEVLCGRYKILGQIGKGTTASVHECWDRKTRNRVVIKVQKESDYDAVMQEIDILESIQRTYPSQNINVVRLLDWFEVPGSICMVFEKGEESLWNYTKRMQTPFSMNDIQNYAHQLITALSQYHRLHITHADIKPENIVFIAPTRPLIDARIEDAKCDHYYHDPNCTCALSTKSSPRSSSSSLLYPAHSQSRLEPYRDRHRRKDEPEVSGGWEELDEESYIHNAPTSWCPASPSSPLPEPTSPVVRFNEGYQLSVTTHITRAAHCESTLKSSATPWESRQEPDHEPELDNNQSNMELGESGCVSLNGSSLPACSKNYRSTGEYQLKMIDFGLAVMPHHHHPKVIGTRAYSGPEIVLVAEAASEPSTATSNEGTQWSESLDIWAVGCVLVEMYTGHTLFPCSDDIEQLALFERTLGPLPRFMIEAASSDARKGFDTRGRLRWPELADDKHSIKSVSSQLPLEQLFARRHALFYDLISRMLCYDQRRRITADEALDHPFFLEVYAD